MELLKDKVKKFYSVKDVFCEENLSIIKMETEVTARKKFVNWLKNFDIGSPKILKIKFDLPISIEKEDLIKQQGIIEGLNMASEYFKNEGFFCEMWTEEKDTTLEVSFISKEDRIKANSVISELIEELLEEPFGLSLTISPIMDLFKIMCCKYKQETFEHPSYNVFKKHLQDYLKKNYQDYYKEIQSTYVENKEIQKDLMLFALYNPLLCYNGESLTLMQAAQLERINEIRSDEDS